MNIRFIPPGRSFVEEIIPLLAGTERDYSANAVVFPGKRPSHFLRKALARRAGKAFIPPAIFSMDGFIDEIYGRLHPGRKLELIDALAILFEIHKTTRERLGGDGFLTPDAFFPIGIKIYRDIEELCIEEIDARRIREIQPLTDEVIPEQTLRRLQSLAFFYEQFYSRLIEKGYSTRSSRYRTAAEEVREDWGGEYRNVIFAGFYALTASERKLFKKFLGKENTRFVFQHGPGIRDVLRALDIPLDVPVEEGTAVSVAPEVFFYASPDAHGQVYALNALLHKKNKTAELDEKTAIVLPSSDTLFPLVRQGLPIDQAEYNISLGYPLHRTSLYGFLNNLMELITSMDEGRVYVPDYLKFALHPYTKNIYFKGSAEITRIIFHTLEEALTRNVTRTFLALEEIEGDRTILSSIGEKMAEAGKEASATEIGEHLRDIHRNTIGKFISFENVGDFARKCSEVLSYIFYGSTARLHPFFFPFSEAFLSALDAVSKSLLGQTAFAESTGYFAFFRKYVMTRRTPFEGTPLRGLQVLGFLETRNLKFDTVFVLDANEGTLPDTVKDNTLLPFRARQILGLPTYLERDRLAAYYFECLIQGAKEVHLFFIENDARERSRYVEKMLWQKQKENSQADAKSYIKSIQYRVRLENAGCGPVEKSPDVVRYLKDFVYSPTALDRYLGCQLRFYYSHVLKIEKRQDPAGRIEKRDIGKLVHDAVSGFFSGKKGLRLRQEDIDPAEMDGIIGQIFEQDYGKDLRGAEYLLQRQTMQHLRDLVEKYYMPLAGKCALTVIDSERKIQRRIGCFKLKGRLDSIERRGERTCIIDYKTASAANNLKINFYKLGPERETWNNAVGSLQLPFYLMLYMDETGAGIADLDAMFLLLGRSQINSQIEAPLFDGKEPENAFETLRSIIFGLLEEIVDGRIPFSPPSDKKRACPFCDFRYMCGTQWVTR